MNRTQIRAAGRSIEYHLRKIREKCATIREAAEAGDPLAAHFWQLLYDNQLGISTDVAGLAEDVVNAAEKAEREKWASWAPSYLAPEQTAAYRAVPYDQRVESLDVSVRTWNRLMKAGIFRISDLAGMTDAELLSIRGFGASCLQDVRTRLDQWQVAPAPPTADLPHPSDKP